MENSAIQTLEAAAQMLMVIIPELFESTKAIPGPHQDQFE